MVLGLLALLAPTSSATDLYVGASHPYPTIASALAASGPGDTLWLDPGLYDESVDFGARSLAIRRNGAGLVRWTAPSGTSIATANGADLQFEGIEFEGSGARRALLLQSSVAMVTNCTFRGGLADGGGAIRGSAATALSVQSSRFVGNHANASGQGGALLLLDSTLDLSDSVFQDNFAEGGGAQGGAIRLNNTTLSTVQRSVFQNNHSDVNGGAILVTSGDLVVDSSVFEANSAGLQGGAIELETGTDVSIVASSFRDNSSPFHGGAIYAVNVATLGLRRNLFCDNRSNTTSLGAWGGALFFYNGAATASNNVFAGGVAHVGGGIGAWLGSSLSSVNNTYVDNTTAWFGSAIYDDGSTVTSNNDLIAFNTSVALGYAVYDTAFVDPISYGLFHASSDFDHNFVAGLGMTSGDPLFGAWPATCSRGAFTLDPYSPAIDTGDPLILDTDSTTSDIGAMGGPEATWDLFVDVDGDGWYAFDDCDDLDATVFPGAFEFCDGIDNDCDYRVDNDDDGAFGAVLTWPDADLDGLGDYWAAPEALCLDFDHVDNDGDCFDADPALWEGPAWFLDYDQDGLGDPLISVSACEAPYGYVADDTDCDDQDPARLGPDPYFPDADSDGEGATVPATLSCDPPAGFVDNDTDCDDANDANFSANVEVCDGQDNDCDGLVDGADPSVDLTSAPEWFADNDQDGYGAGYGTFSCNPIFGQVANNLDCDDTNLNVNPGVVEVCDGVDNDCSGAADDNAANAPTWYTDADSDDYGSDVQPTQSCQQPPGTVTVGGDCEDANPAINPAATEICDGIDNNCDSVIDLDAVDALTWYPDGDGDGFGIGIDDADALTLCAMPGGYAPADNDCNDGRATAYPGAPELCNGEDDDCDGLDDEDLTVSAWYPDLDADGFGDASAAPFDDCGPPPDHVADHTDCDDTAPATHPGTPDHPDNGIDEDCDGADAVGDNTRDPPDDTGGAGSGKPSAGCGCSSAPESPPLVLFALPLLTALFRRRRQHPR